MAYFDRLIHIFQNFTAWSADKMHASRLWFSGLTSGSRRRLMFSQMTHRDRRSQRTFRFYQIIINHENSPSRTQKIRGSPAPFLKEENRKTKAFVQSVLSHFPILLPPSPKNRILRMGSTFENFAKPHLCLDLSGGGGGAVSLTCL